MTTDENDVVLDPFSGTGTTAISAKRLGRKFIGFELDPEYVKISNEKLSDIKPDFKLDDVWVSYYLNDIVTIRNNDWDKIKDCFIIPNPIRKIDFQKFQLKKEIKIPKGSKNKTKKSVLKNEANFHPIFNFSK